MWSAANSLSCAERSPIMTAAPGSISSDQRLSIVRSCGKHKAVRSQNRSIIDLVRFIYQSPPGWHGPLMGLSGWVSSGLSDAWANRDMDFQGVTQSRVRVDLHRANDHGPCARTHVDEHASTNHACPPMSMHAQG